MSEKLDVKYIALDLDGTLFSDDLKILPKTKEALLSLQNKGIKLIIASGRPLKTVLSIAEELKMKEHLGYVVSYNGALVYDMLGNKIYENKLSVGESKKIFEILEKYDLFRFYYRDSENMCIENNLEIDENSGKYFGRDKIYEIIKKTGQFNIIETKDIKETVDRELFKVMGASFPKYLEDNLSNIEADLDGNIVPLITLPWVIEFCKKDVSKGYAIEKLNINPEYLMAFGDGMNDQHMLEFAKYGIAMGNARQSLKDIAFDTTSSNNEEGIYKSLVKYKLIEE